MSFSLEMSRLITNFHYGCQVAMTVNKDVRRTLVGPFETHSQGLHRARLTHSFGKVNKNLDNRHHWFGDHLSTPYSIGEVKEKLTLLSKSFIWWAVRRGKVNSSCWVNCRITISWRRNARNRRVIAPTGNRAVHLGNGQPTSFRWAFRNRAAGTSAMFQDWWGNSGWNPRFAGDWFESSLLSIS